MQCTWVNSLYILSRGVIGLNFQVKICFSPGGLFKADLKISLNRHLPFITKTIAIYDENVNLHLKSCKFSSALQPEALVNMSLRLDFSKPAKCSKGAVVIHHCALSVGH